MLSFICLPTAALSPVTTAPSWQTLTAASTIDALERTVTGQKPLSLLDDMYDESSGLCSEGVWHNSWLGVSRVLAARALRSSDSERADAQLASARVLGDSLYALSFDGTGFRMRTSSNAWQSAEEAAESLKAAGESIAFYEPSDERRCISSAAAVIFYSLLAEEDGAEASDAMARLVEVGDAFTAEFFDTKVCRFRRDASSDYWRAVDQALGCLACLRLAKTGHKAASSRAMATCAADSLLREFGYSLYATEAIPPGTYLGRVASRNSWHDSIACLALLMSGVLGVGGESPTGLVRAMADSYRSPEAGHMMHTPRELTPGEGSDVAFSSTQALWSAVVRAAELQSSRAEAAGGVDGPALRAWHAVHVDAESGLLPVANVYPDARLWANTEWAAWSLLDKELFDLR